MDPHDTDPKDAAPNEMGPKDAEPETGSRWDVAIIVVIAVLMSVFAVFMLAHAFPPK